MGRDSHEMHPELFVSQEEYLLRFAGKCVLNFVVIVNNGGGVPVFNRSKKKGLERDLEDELVTRRPMRT